VSSRNSASLSNSPSSSINGFSARRRFVAGLWATGFVVMHAISALAQGLGAASAGVESKVCQAGPINDTIEYLLWLLQQL
jgi:hypothetical protein